jgi:phosphotransferase system, enzyme I, PtsP
MQIKQNNQLDLSVLHKIVDYANSAHTLEQQIERLVTQVREAMGVDVCSLFQLDEQKNLHMIANVGLENAVGEVVLPAGAGLAGVVAETKLPLNLANAAEHPNYQLFTAINEESLCAYLGVPVIHLGQVIGVITVQSHVPRPFSDIEASFLVTIAAQLANSLVRRVIPPKTTNAVEGRCIEGFKGAPGKAIGKLSLLISKQTLKLAEEPGAESVPRELIKLRNAVDRTREEIAAARSHLQTNVSEDVLSLFSVYEHLLAGDLLEMVEQQINQGASAFAAVRSVVDDQVAAFENIEDDYLRARGEDVRQLGDKLLAALLNPAQEPHNTAAQIVLVGDLVSITDIGQYSAGQLSAVVSLQGSAQSHTAILANALGIPAVVGTGPIDHLKDGDDIIVDGDQGMLILAPSPAQCRAYEAAIESARLLQTSLLALNDQPARTKDGHIIKLYANTGLLSDIQPGLASGAEGIGLFRSEIPFIVAPTLPSEQDQYNVYRPLLEAYYPRPVTIRTLDVGGDKQLPYLPFEEDNPCLGWRGIRFELDNPAILFAQLRALLKANIGLGNLQIMLPMVSHLSDVVSVVNYMEQLLAELRLEHAALQRPRLGIMIEVPAVVPLLAKMAPLLDFVSVGTNDLTQYLLAVDRGNLRVSNRYDALHPGVIQTIATIINSCQALNLELSICGEMASDPVAAALLVGMGVKSVSMGASRIPKIRAVILNISQSECASLALQAYRCDDAEQVRAMIGQYLVKQGLADLLEGNAQNVLSR